MRAILALLLVAALGGCATSPPKVTEARGWEVVFDDGRQLSGLPAIHLVEEQGDWREASGKEEVPGNRILVDLPNQKLYYTEDSANFCAYGLWATYVHELCRSGYTKLGFLPTFENLYMLVLSPAVILGHGGLSFWTKVDP
ncbi:MULTISPECIES: hypothetical protein [Pseudomonadota]|uniref:hypothetical protein n=1 Tax=Pseudomonadota TaxID=1224 RepID=UPI001CA70B5B|nr:MULTISPECIES: hypothetical protein [Pseudomonadota]MBY8965952.1 hypothetical protein [Algiphilus acroporae]MCI5069295.1 hypothetical protein [Acidovorax sp.]MCI5102391.1 hypothetical protein [Algiphilus sp.]